MSYALNQPSLPSCQLVQLTHRFAYIHVQYVTLVMVPQPHGVLYLLTNPLPTIFALNLLLDHRIIRRPAIHTRYNEKRQRDDKQADDFADEFAVSRSPRSVLFVSQVFSSQLSILDHTPLLFFDSITLPPT